MYSEILKKDYKNKIVNGEWIKDPEIEDVLGIIHEQAYDFAKDLRLPCEVDDLIQEGCIIFIKCLDKFKEGKVKAFIPYLTICLRRDFKRYCKNGQSLFQSSKSNIPMDYLVDEIDDEKYLACEYSEETDIESIVCEALNEVEAIIVLNNYGINRKKMSIKDIKNKFFEKKDKDTLSRIRDNAIIKLKIFIEKNVDYQDYTKEIFVSKGECINGGLI